MQAFPFYLKATSLLTLTLLAIVAAFNMHFDPYDIYHFTEDDSTVFDKPSLNSRLRLHKAYAVRSMKPDGILIGTSRVLTGLDPQHPALSNDRWYNLGLPAATIYEIFRYIQHADAVHSLKAIVMDVEYPSFDPRPQLRKPGYEEARLAVNEHGVAGGIFIKDYIDTLFSFDAARASLEEAFLHKAIPEPITAGGMRQNNYREVTRAGGHRELVNAVSRRHLRNFYQQNIDPENFQQEMAPRYGYFEQILRLAHRNSIQLTMFIPPTHAVYMVIKRRFGDGAWQVYQDWRTNIVRINDNVARELKVLPFPIWDFSGFNNYTEDPIPDADSPHEMKWYWEISHFKKELGNVMLDRMLADPQLQGQNDFGVLISPDIIQSHNDGMNDAESRYVRENPHELQQLQDFHHQIVSTAGR